MNIYTYSAAWFRHVIAALSPLDARSHIIEHVRNGTGGIVPIVELLSPDVLTRRAADEATATVEIDRIPLFNVERDGEFWREIDHDAASLLTREERAELRKVSPIHREWLDAYDDPRLYAGIVALEFPPRPEQTRALAAAFGCGPLPSWIAPIAPALFALDDRYDWHGTGETAQPFVHRRNLQEVWRDVRLLADWSDDRQDTFLSAGTSVLTEWIMSTNTETVRSAVLQCLLHIGWLE